MVRGFCIGKGFPVSGSSQRLQSSKRCHCLAGGILNLIITLQILWYDKNTRAQAKQSAKKKE